MRSARAGAAARPAAKAAAARAMGCRSFDVSEKGNGAFAARCVCTLQRQSAAEPSLPILLVRASPHHGFLFVWACAKRLARGKQKCPSMTIDPRERVVAHRDRARCREACDVQRRVSL